MYETPRHLTKNSRERFLSALSVFRTLRVPFSPSNLHVSAGVSITEPPIENLFSFDLLRLQHQSYETYFLLRLQYLRSPQDRRRHWTPLTPSRLHALACDWTYQETTVVKTRGKHEPHIRWS